MSALPNDSDSDKQDITDLWEWVDNCHALIMRKEGGVKGFCERYGLDRGSFYGSLRGARRLKLCHYIAFLEEGFLNAPAYFILDISRQSGFKPSQVNDFLSQALNSGDEG